MARFKVTGRGSFPLDMLRKDRAHPATADDAARIEQRGLRTVELETGERLITNGRWRSFGWRVEGVIPMDVECDVIGVGELFC